MNMYFVTLELVSSFVATVEANNIKEAIDKAKAEASKWTFAENQFTPIKAEQI